MATLQIDGVGTVEIGNEFLSLSAERQAAEVDAIASAMGKAPAAKNTAKDYGGMSGGEVALEAVKNIPASAVQFAKDVAEPVLHPIDTAIAIKNIGAGVLQKVGLLSGTDQEKYADAVGRFFVDRYGSSEGIKKAIATDPVGVLSDVATVLTGGGALAAKAPGLAGKVGEVVRAAGSAIDPINVAGRAVKATGDAAATVIGGLGTQTGGESIRAAARAGAEGGDAARAFAENIRGAAPIESVVSDAKAALQNLRIERGDAYRAAMADIGKDQTVLKFTEIDNAISKIEGVKKYKGQDLSPATAGVRADVAAAINDWKALDPKEFHTPEGMDALKQKIGDIKDATAPGTPERLIADQAYKAVRQTIIDQVPEYAKVMKGYEEATTIIKDIEQSLSLKQNASIDTAVRKLQSVLRNNVNTNYGRREVLADYLVKAGAGNLVTKLAGQALNSAMPRGVGRVSASLIAAGGGAGVLSGAATLPGLVAIGLLPMTSPRIVGETAFGLGKASRLAPVAGAAARASFQAGRAERSTERR